ncbi:MAG: hypothetical protein E7255_10870 [Lachnospiraceae bacterium]|jgi:hypothetical protein|nr:hypothetical protein [Lachnospiraceae bacterium]
MNNKTVDVIVTFNKAGKIKPNYIRLEDDDQLMHTYKIYNPRFDREEKFAGTAALLFSCYIINNGCKQMIKIKYHANTYQWILVS